MVTILELPVDVIEYISLFNVGNYFTRVCKHLHTSQSTDAIQRRKLILRRRYSQLYFEYDFDAHKQVFRRLGKEGENRIGMNTLINDIIEVGIEVMFTSIADFDEEFPAEYGIAFFCIDLYTRNHDVDIVSKLKDYSEELSKEYDELDMRAADGYSGFGSSDGMEDYDAWKEMRKIGDMTTTIDRFIKELQIDSNFILRLRDPQMSRIRYIASTHMYRGKHNIR